MSMKITFEEEIESRKAWFDSMYCSKCDEGIYSIHHQLLPKTGDCWWVECENCGHTCATSPSRAIAIARWKQC